MGDTGRPPNAITKQTNHIIGWYTKVIVHYGHMGHSQQLKNFGIYKVHSRQMDEVQHTF